MFHGVPSEQQIQTIPAARKLLNLVPEEEGEDTNEVTINALHVQPYLLPVVTDPQQFVHDSFEFIIQTASYLSRSKRKGGNSCQD